MFKKEKSLKDTKNFNTWFNEQFEKNKLEDSAETGYGNWLKSNEDIIDVSNVSKANMASEIDKIKKYLQVYLDDVIIPKLNNELVGENDEPINVTIYKINYGEANPNRINFFLDMDPDWSKGSFTNKINSDISSFFRMLGVDKNLHIYWNKRPLF
jgi:hypothetical protein